jgi:hypothetical protein
LISSFPARIAGHTADDGICAIGKAVDDLQPFLETWEQLPGTPAKRHVAQFICDNYPAVAKKQRLTNAFWAERDDQRLQVERWIHSANVKRLLQDARLQVKDEETFDELSASLDRLQWIANQISAASKPT